MPSLDFLEAEQDGAKMAAFNRLVRKKDDEKGTALAQLAQQKDAALAAKDVELAELRARLGEGP